MAAEEDHDIDSILASINSDAIPAEEAEPVPEASEAPVAPVKKVKKPKVAPPIVVPTDQQVVRPAVALIERHDHGVANSATGDANAHRQLVDKTIAQFDAIGDEVVKNTKADREKITELIDDMQSHALGEGANISGVALEALVNAHNTRATMTLTLVKLLDSRSKLVAALKAQTSITNNVLNANDGTLENILAQPVDDDFAGDEK